MDRDQIIAAVFVALIVVAIIAVAVMSSGDGDGLISPAKRFEARQGTTRDNATPFFSDKGFEVTGSAEGDISAQRQDTEPEPVADEPEDWEPPPSRVEQRIEHILLYPTPEKRLEALEKLWETEGALAKAAHIYGAMGAVYVQAGADFVEQAREAFDRAYAAAEPDEQAAVRLREVGALRDAGRPEEALERLRAMPDGPPSAERLRLAVMGAQVLEDLGRDAEAESAYREVINAFNAAPQTYGAAGESVYRQTCLLLSNRYREAGRPDEARALVRTMHANLTGP